MVSAIIAGAALGRLIASLLLGLDIDKMFAAREIAMTGWIAVGRDAAPHVVWLVASPDRRSERAGGAYSVAAGSPPKKPRCVARLQALQAQIEPHFLFNTLATLDSLIVSDPPRARELLRSLNRFLRATLEASRAESETSRISSRCWMRCLPYTRCASARDSTYSLDLPADCANLAVPPMLLQPLVENALKHGIQGTLGRWADRG